MYVIQFYTFLETTLVTLSLLPHFIMFFSDEEIPGSPSSLATTFLAFGKIYYHYLCWMTCVAIALLVFYSQCHSFSFTYINMIILLLSVLNLAFALSVFGFLIMHISLVSGNTTTIEVLVTLLLCLVKLKWWAGPFVVAHSFNKLSMHIISFNVRNELEKLVVGLHLFLFNFDFIS